MTTEMKLATEIQLDNKNTTCGHKYKMAPQIQHNHTNTVVAHSALVACMYRALNLN